MIPISPAGRYETDTRSSQQRNHPQGGAADLASRHRPLASHSGLGAEERAAIRRSFAVAAAVVALLVSGAVISVALSSGASPMLAMLG